MAWEDWQIIQQSRTMTREEDLWTSRRYLEARTHKRDLERIVVKKFALAYAVLEIASLLAGGEAMAYE